MGRGAVLLGVALGAGACRGAADGPEPAALEARFPGAGWRLGGGEGSIYQGWIRAAAGAVELQLVGPLVATPGPVLAEVELAVVGGAPVTWLAFPLGTPAGEAEAVLRLQGQSALLDLGARAGEGELVFPLQPGGPGDVEAVAAAAAAGAAGRAAWARAWAVGELGVEDDAGRIVGGVRLRGPGAPAEVWVADGLWATAGWAPADREQEGGDLLLAFPVEPSFGDDIGVMRILVGTGEVIIPQAAGPDPEDRRLRLRPAATTEAEREAASASARSEADAAEAAWLREHLPLLGSGLARAGGCLRPEDVDPAWPLLLRGYAVDIRPRDAGCELELSPEPPQHRRRLRGRWDRAGGAQVSPAGPGAPPAG